MEKMTYHGIIKNVKIDYKTKTITAEIKFPGEGIISEAKKRKKIVYSSETPLKTLVKMGFRDAIKESNVNLTWGRVKMR